MADNYSRGSIYQLDLTSLRPDPAQARKYLDPDSLAELTASVTKYGVLQPILFRQDEPGAPLFIVAGERRVEACWAAGLTTIPGIFVSGNHREISLVESLRDELANLAWQGLTEEEKQDLTSRLQDLKQGADALLQAMGPVLL